MVEYYSPVSITGYNISPPTDDGVDEAQNEVTWQVIKEKLPDPLKTAIEALDTELQAAFAKIPWNGINAQTSNYTLTANDLGKLITIDGAFTLTLLAAATASDGFTFGVKNVGTDIVTIDGDGTEEIDGSETVTLDDQNDAVILVCDGSNWKILAAITETGFKAGNESMILASQVFG